MTKFTKCPNCTSRKFFYPWTYQILLVSFLVLSSVQGCSKQPPVCTSSAGVPKEYARTVAELKTQIPELQTQHHRPNPIGDEVPILDKELQLSTFYVFAHQQRNYSGIQLQNGATYKFDLTPVDHWFDATIATHPIHGWGSGPYGKLDGIIRYLGKTLSYSSEYDLMTLLGIVEEEPDKGTFVCSFADHIDEERSNDEIVVGQFTPQKTGNFLRLPTTRKWTISTIIIMVM